MKNKNKILATIFLVLLAGCGQKEVEEIQEVSPNVITSKVDSDILLSDMTGSESERVDRLLVWYDTVVRPLLVNSRIDLGKWVEEKDGYSDGVYIGVKLDSQYESELVQSALQKLGQPLESEYLSKLTIPTYPYLSNKLTSYMDISLSRLAEYANELKQEYDLVKSRIEGQRGSDKPLSSNNMSGLAKSLSKWLEINKTTSIYLAEMDKEANALRDKPIQYPPSDQYSPLAEFQQVKGKFEVEVKETQENLDETE